MSDLWGVGFMGCRVCGLSDLSGVGLSYGVSPLWGYGLGCRTYGVSQLRDGVAFVGCRTCWVSY